MTDDLIARELYIRLCALMEAAEAVVENWERGDLAGAVNVLEAARADSMNVVALAADIYDPVEVGEINGRT